MELNNRIEILIQSAQIVQSKGVLTLDDAVVVKSAIDNIVKNEDIANSINVLIKTSQLGQSKGCFSLKDAYLLYIAIDGLIELLTQPKPENQEQGKEKE